MNSKILKLDAPYNVIYAGGKVGRHIATLITWADDPDANGEVLESHQYPIIDQGEELPAGTLVTEAELEDCRTICSVSEKTGKLATNLYWVAKIIEYDFQQMEPAGAGYILERMRLLDCKIAMPTEKNADGEELQRVHYTATLAITPLNGSWEESRYYRVKSNRYEGFYFEAEGTEEEIYQDLSEQKSAYMNWFNDDICSITFRTYDMELDDVIKRLNDPNNF